MSFAVRVFSSLALSWSLINPAFAQVQSSPSALNSNKAPTATGRGTGQKYDELASALLAARTDDERAALLKAEAVLVTPDLSRALGGLSERLRGEKQFTQALAAAQLAIKLAEQLHDRAAQGLAWENSGRAYAGLRDYRQAAEHFRHGLILFEELGDKQTASSLLGRMATCYYHLENYQEALNLNLRRLKLKEELNDREWMASTLDDIALSHYRLGNFQAAVAALRRAVPIYEEVGNTGGVARVLMLLGDIQIDQSDYEEAIANYERAGAIFAKNGDAVGPVLARLNVGQVYGKMGDSSRALGAYQKALEGFTEQKNANRMALALSAIGGVYGELGDHEQARDYFQRSLKLYDEAKRPLGSAEALNAIGNSYRLQGNYSRALEYLRQGLKLLEESGRKYGLADALTEMGDLYFQQGDENLALEFYQRSQTLFEELGSKQMLAALVGRRGTLEQRRGNYQKALAVHEQSLTLYRAIGNKSGMAEALASVGNSHLLLKQPEPALASYRESRALFEEIGNRNGVAQSLTGIGRVEQTRGNHAEALAAADAAAVLADKTGNLELLWQVNSVIGRSRLALKQTEQAQQSFERAVASIELMRAQSAGGELARRYFLEHRLAPYYSLIDLLVAQGKPHEALVWAERSKARVLLDVMQSSRVDVRRSMTVAEQQQERKLRAEIIALNSQVTRASQLDQPDQTKLRELKSLREKARLDYEAFQTSLYGAHPELRAQRGEAPVIQANEIATLLPNAGSVLLEYVVTDDVTYLFGITKANGKTSAEMQVFTIPVKRAELSKQIQNFRQQLAGRDLGFRAPARQLYRLLLAPAQALLRGKTDIVIVPDDKLWELPLQALLTENDRYVIETSAVSYAPSLTVLREMKTRRDRHKAAPAALLAVGNPAIRLEKFERAKISLSEGELDLLPAAEQEVKALGQLYGPARSKVYVGAEAREDRVKSEATQASILHFATHGVLNDTAPMYSHLMLAPGDTNEDGLLEAWEVLQMDLQAELAVLSACETARGRVGAGEGIIGLTWALFVAGVPTSVVSQWQVESASTRDLMVSFHRGLSSPPRARQAKATKAEALRQAALKLLRQPETSHPFYWAPFVLVGDDR